MLLVHSMVALVLFQKIQRHLKLPFSVLDGGHEKSGFQIPRTLWHCYGEGELSTIWLSLLRQFKLLLISCPWSCSIVYNEMAQVAAEPPRGIKLNSLNEKSLFSRKLGTSEIRCKRPYLLRDWNRLLQQQLLGSSVKGLFMVFYQSASAKTSGWQIW